MNDRRSYSNLEVAYPNSEVAYSSLEVAPLNPTGKFSSDVLPEVAQNHDFTRSPDSPSIWKRKRSWIIVAVVLLVIIGGAVAGKLLKGRSGQASSVHSPSPITSNNHNITYGCTIISASYGNLDVTLQLRKLSSTSSSAQNQFTFIPDNTLFGQDPCPGFRKAVVVVYRVSNTSPGKPTLYGPPQVYRGLESDTAVINYGVAVQPYVVPCPPSNRFIVDATWYTQNITGEISSLSDAASSSALNLSVDSSLGPDPAVNTLKQLTITYSEVDSEGATQFYVKIGKDHDNMQIPPAPPVTLNILAMNFGGLDVTEPARALITPQQTWEILSNSSDTLFGDPWFGIWKSICILYQYGNRPLELLVAGEYDGLLSLDPYAPVDPRRTEFLIKDDPKLLAVIWGIMQYQTGPLPESKIASFNSTGTIPCTTEWFGFNGWPGVQKTCVAFLNSSNGTVYDISVREGENLRLWT